ncbi:saccharopine dehydrogenase [Streptomyces hygroscopicus]|uniref:saccharopine dehydrogenase n=1 Tax=Streptomyces hygroscopicus TaxID=1912 RepID=UPI002240377B|nr:saccharopine dehydrogenase [Streptomyces hygroscopicus]
MARMKRERPRLWLRAETRASERRTPLVPEDAARLVAVGFEVTVEDSPQRVFPLADYAAVGCRTAPAGTWREADDDQYVLGLKELPDAPATLRHRHIFFGHCFKRQSGAERLLARFRAGGGVLLDLEYLTDDQGRRVAAFGYWAGYIGGALAVLHRRGRLATPLRDTDRATLDGLLRASAQQARPTSALVIGALGRCGRGARDALETAGVTATCWDLPETRHLDRDALLTHDVLVNTVLTTVPAPPFVTTADLLRAERTLSVISDVTCDAGSPCNLLPVYDSPTDWDRPVRRLTAGERPVDLIAIDNLPSLLPLEASRAFSADLLSSLLSLRDGDPRWDRCRRTFEQAVQQDVPARTEEVSVVRSS